MATYYLRSGAAGAANGTSWANAYTTLTAALSGKSAGDTIFVSEDHSETTALDLTFTSPGSAAAPCRVICVDHTGSVPPVSADRRSTAAISTSAGNDINFTGGNIIYEGIIFSAGSSSSTARIFATTSTDQSVKFKNCALRIATTSSSGNIVLGSSSAGGSLIVLDNTTVQFSSTAQTISCTASLLWMNTPSAITGATIPTILLSSVSGNRSARFDLRGVDLSAAGSGKTLFDLALSGVIEIVASMVDCKIDSAVTLTTRPPARGSGGLDYLRCDSGGTNYKHGRVRYEGTLTEETTIVRTGGANDGTTTISWKIVTTANSNEFYPFESLPIAIWNDTTGSSVTATIEGIWGGGAVPNNDDIWIEAEYLGSSGSPLASFVNDGKADILAANAGHTSSSETWGGSTTKFKMAVTFTPQQKGWVFVRVKAAKASSTFYIDPKITLS
jgi:hypothetical protein